MRRALALSVACFCTLQLFGQPDRFAYAITDLTAEGNGWNALRRLDLATGRYSDVLLDGTNAGTAVYDASTRKRLVLQPDARYGTLLQTPFGTGVAAAAYDKAQQRLYFTPMFADQLRYVDLATMKLYQVTGQPFTGAGDMHNNEGKVVTRMVIAADGWGYAINNDGSNLVRFSTGRKPTIEQLGALVDDPANNGVSIHNRCTSFGGDMVADASGNLYILSARNHVFKVSVQNRVASFLGVVKGLPANFTVNGAVVDADGDLLVSSALDGSTYYKIDPSDWTAKPYAAAATVYRCSDLANGNLLFAKKGGSQLATERRAVTTIGKTIALFPNPVKGSGFSVQFSKVPQGEYTVELTDMMGRTVSARRVVVATDVQVQAVQLPQTASAVYLVKVYDAKRRPVFSEKLLVE